MNLLYPRPQDLSLSLTLKQWKNQQCTQRESTTQPWIMSRYEMDDLLALALARLKLGHRWLPASWHANSLFILRVEGYWVNNPPWALGIGKGLRPGKGTTRTGPLSKYWLNQCSFHIISSNNNISVMTMNQSGKLIGKKSSLQKVINLRTFSIFFTKLVT